MKIGIFPLITSSELDDFLPRVVWYLYPFRKKISTCVFYINFKFGKKITQYKYFDDVIYSNIRHFNISYVFNSNMNDFSFLFNLDYVFLTNDLMFKKIITYKKTHNLNVDIIRIDHIRLSYADSFFLRFAEKIPNLHKKYKKISEDKILSLIKPLRTEKIYLFGTGPNFKYAIDYDYSDGLVIVCNSIVVNKDIILKLKPKIFVMADPIFHAGPSNYAADFRKHLVEMFEINPCVIVVPLRDYHIYKTYLPKHIVDFLVPIFFKIPSSDESPFYTDIFEHLQVKTTNNILTLFQLPLAASLGSEIYLLGCDGRPKSKNSYFWSHNSKVQINDKMQDIKNTHKGFFRIEYDVYYNKHIYFLTKLINIIEKNGKKVTNLTPSYILPLQKRISDIILRSNKQKNTCDLSIIIPICNMQGYIEKYLNCLLEIQDLNYEVIAVDDFSEDLSFELLLKKMQTNKKLNVYQNFGENGLHGVVKTGLKTAVGEYILILDCDAIVYPDRLKSNINNLKHNKEKKLSFATLDFISEKGMLCKNYKYINSYSCFIFEREFINNYLQYQLDSPKEILLKFPTLIIENRSSVVSHIIYSNQYLKYGNIFFKTREYDLAYLCYNNLNNEIKKYVQMNIELCNFFRKKNEDKCIVTNEGSFRKSKK
ncbi:glycosyltransferase family 2 protein [Campylobacter lari]|uniref:Glycosyltransferase family 2 protein n=1 Tax=Campylobacter lari TaxID=201 RepID=A0A7M1ME02_CAMLA|nr:glycosyltransferase family 2 protein [Campylobacter lari]EAH7580391.1 glycosyltransferase family 2 protein [Campylobacter lari]EAI8625120.1 glycosyltransferase family 2 protein [Campylobacter lari]EAJ0324534.1 glycosyltransferase family 2 protein [Campylobacter lari]EAK0945608.1 glycosyltransferase family 2 protein [Campylobacter lari]EAK0949233.1 glycosyltransferase family 2 protein [Campylobacter lari]